MNIQRRIAYRYLNVVGNTGYIALDCIEDVRLSDFAHNYSKWWTTAFAVRKTAEYDGSKVSNYYVPGVYSLILEGSTKTFARGWPVAISGALLSDGRRLVKYKTTYLPSDKGIFVSQ